MTVPVRRGGLLSLVFPIPSPPSASTISGTGKDQQLRNDEEKPEPDGEAIAAWLDAIGNR